MRAERAFTSHDVSKRAASRISTERTITLPCSLSSLVDQPVSKSRHRKLCKSILAIASIVQRPLTQEEMESFVDIPTNISGNDKAWAEIIGFCGSLLRLRGRVISLVHQSAKDFLVSQACADIYPSGIAHIHYSVFTQSLGLLKKTLRRDLYNLKDPGFSINEVNAPPSPDPLAAVRYCCVYWIEHLQASLSTRNHNILQYIGLIYEFIHKCYLYWLEASSLCRSMSNAQVSIAKLESLLLEEVT